MTLKLRQKKFYSVLYCQRVDHVEQKRKGFYAIYKYQLALGWTMGCVSAAIIAPYEEHRPKERHRVRMGREWSLTGYLCSIKSKGILRTTKDLVAGLGASNEQ